MLFFICLHISSIKTPQGIFFLVKLFYTHGAELYDKTLEVYGHILETVLVDTSGHQLYKWIVKALCDGNAFYALCFDFTNKGSLEMMKTYLKEYNIQKCKLLSFKILATAIFGWIFMSLIFNFHEFTILLC